jgi:serine/threonine protein kinase
VGFSPGVTNSPTITTPAMTQLGVILGTAAYMSPEQAKGRPADKGSDVWAFGCVLYEMLTSRRAFEGADVSDTLAAVLRVPIGASFRRISRRRFERSFSGASPRIARVGSRIWPWRDFC